MDRYIIRETRAGAECLQGNQIIAFPTSTPGNNMIPEQFYTPYGSEFQNVRENRYSLPQNSYAPTNMMQGGQPQIMSGIDPNYLAAYSNSNAPYTPGHQHMQREVQMERQMHFRSEPFGADYQNRNLTVERNKTFVQAHSETARNFESKTPRVNNYDIKTQQPISYNIKPQQPTSYDIKPQQPMSYDIKHQQPMSYDIKPQQPMSYDIKHQQPMSYDIKPKPIPTQPLSSDIKPKPQIIELKLQMPKTPQQMTPRNSKVPPKKPSEPETPKYELQSQLLTRFDKLKALHRSGPRVFSGPVDKVLKWHKAIQEIGVLIIFEVVAKCVSIQPGSSCSKNLVIRDDNGPAMQVVYYEIDFLLPELKPPCTVRVVGRMMPGTCRLQAFNVRPATGDDVATLSRRAAAAAHHVEKLCKDYGAGGEKM